MLRPEKYLAISLPLAKLRKNIRPRHVVFFEVAEEFEIFICPFGWRRTPLLRLSFTIPLDFILKMIKNSLSETYYCQNWI